MILTKEAQYKALASRDSRFDGLFYTCVKTTRIYCRPICPTHPPKIENCTFVASAAEAEKAGYRPCLRCRPELAPSMRSTDDSPAHQLCKHMEETLLVDETLGEAAKAYDLSERQLRRVFIDAYGVEPKHYLTTRRLLFAKQLLQDTALPVIDIAYAVGLTPGRLTINMREAYGFTPERFRKETEPAEKSPSVTLRVDYRPPLDWQAMLGILSARATPAEWVVDGAYHRLVDGRTVMVTKVADKDRLHIQLPVELSRQSHTIVCKVRNLFDLDANPLVIRDALAKDPFMAVLVKKHPGIRVPGSWNGFELLLRVIIGQQISVAGATTLMRRLADTVGMTPEAIAKSSPERIAAIGVPAKRAVTLWEAGRRAKAGLIDMDERDPERFYEQLVAVPGIGPWTAEYLRMRVLHWPDAFPAGDLGVQKALAGEAPTGKKQSQPVLQRALIERSNAWRPWRSYATMLLWRSVANKGG